MEEFDLQELLDAFKKGYIDRIENRYDTLDDKFKNNFPFYNCIDFLNLTFIKLNKDRTDNEFLIVITNNNESFQKVIDYTQDESNEYKRFFAQTNALTYVDPIKAASFILPEQALENKVYVHGIFIHSMVFLSLENMNLFGKYLADNHRKSIHDLQETKTYNHDYEKTTSFSFLDFEGLIKKVNDKDFEEQMKQAEFCYKHKVYLSAACTFSVCLETVLMLILDKNGIKTSDQSTILNSLGEKLREKSIISRRDNNRILVTYSIRNATSHTNKTKVIQNDCEGILKTIDYFVNEYLS